MIRQAGINSTTFDLNGAFLLPVDFSRSDLQSNQRRVTKTETLDGGTVVVDNGFSNGDRVVTIETYTDNETEAQLLWEFFQNYSEIEVSLPLDGVYSANLLEFSNSFRNITLKLYLNEKLS